jgi:ribonucleoside-triphosphate reductase
MMKVSKEELELDLDSDIDANLDSDIDANLDSDIDANLDSDIDANLDSDIDADLDSEPERGGILQSTSKRVRMIFSVMASPNRIDILRILNSKIKISCWIQIQKREW